jgi:hypothetical protein
MLSDVEGEGRGGRGGIPKRYRRGLYSTRRTKTRQVPGQNLMNSLLGGGRGCC